MNFPSLYSWYICSSKVKGQSPKST